MTGKLFASGASIALAIVLVLMMPIARAQVSADFDLPSQPLADALRAVGKRAGINILIDRTLVDGLSAQPLKASLTVDEALTRLLSGSGLKHQFVNEHTVILVMVKAPTRAAPDTTHTFAEENGGDLAQTHGGGSVQETGAGSEASTNDPEEPESDSQNKADEVVVVIGSRIRRKVDTETANPVLTITRNELEQTGQPSVARALQRLPQNFGGHNESIDVDPIVGNGNRGVGINLRGLGIDATLVLINGHRLAKNGQGGTFTDIGNIPMAAVERIEILADGASAVFGGDAIGGVVNIIMREDFTGVSSSIRGAEASQGGYGERAANILAGLSGSWGHVIAGYEYFEQDMLRVFERDFLGNRDFTARGGTDFRSTFSSPGNVRAVDGNLDSLSALTGRTVAAVAIPAAQNGRSLAVHDFVSQLGNTNRFDLNSTLSLTPHQQRHVLFATSAFQPSSKLEAYADLLLATRDMMRTTGFESFSAPVPASNPFNPFGEPVIVDLAFADLGGLANKSDTKTLDATLGLRNRALITGWQWDAYATFGHESVDIGVPPGFDALRRVNIPAALANTDPAVSLNVFGDGTGNTPAALSSIIAPSTTNGSSSLASLTSLIEGPALSVFGRTIRVTAGGEHRYESARTEQIAATIEPVLIREVTGGRHVSALFGETLIPIVAAPRTLLRRLELEGAVRHDDYSDFGSETTYRAGLVWSPVASLLIRGSFGTSFKPPQLRDVTFPQRVDVIALFDPNRGETTPGVSILSGGNPDLRPETAENATLGLVFESRLVPGLAITAGYYRVDYEERIFQPGVAQAFANEATLPGVITRAPPTPADVAAGRPGQLTEFNIRWRNLQGLVAKGFDVGVNYAFNSALGGVSADLTGTFVDQYEITFVPGTPPVEQVGTLGSPPDFRGRLTLGWNRARWGASLGFNFTDDYKQGIAANARTIDAYRTLDGSLTYRTPFGPARQMIITAGATNLTDEEPPFVNDPTGYDPRVADPRGRVVYLSLGVDF